MRAAGHGVQSGYRVPPVTLPVALGLAACAGLFAAIAGGAAGPRAIYYSAVLGAIALGGFVAITRREPARFAFLALVAAFPLADVPVPPGRLGIRVFDVVMLALAASFVARRLFVPQAGHGALFPSRSLAVAWLALAICVACSLYPAVSLRALFACLAVYAFFLFALDELRREGGFVRFALLWSVVLLVLSLGLFVDHLFQVNLSLRGGNLNQSSYATGLPIWRAGGFFQDPQKAGAFLAAMIAFLLVPAVRGHFAGRRMRFLVWFAVIAGIAALFTTIARGAIVACLLVSAIALFVFNRWHPGMKMLAGSAAVIALLVAVMLPADAWLAILPDMVASRFAHVADEFQIRLMIWFDTWEMFERHPLTGVGPGSFQSYLLETRPGVTGYYGIGVAEGVSYVPDQPESGYLKILYEGGILGSVAVLVLAGDAIRRAAAALAQAPVGSHARGEVIAALAGLATFCITFTTLFTAGDPRIAALLMFQLAVIWHHAPAVRPRAPRVART